jgi:superfamily II DNA or RNA helicase
MTHAQSPSVGQVLTGPQFSEPMRVETIQSNGVGIWVVGLVGLRSEQFRRVTLTETELAGLQIRDTRLSFSGDGALLKLGLDAYALGIAWEYDPYFGLSVSRVDPLPHQLEAVYDYLLKAPQIRFLLADDAGAGKTIMAGLLIRELKLRGLAERVLIVGPANLAFQWQRELKDKFGETFDVLRGGDIRDQYGSNQWLQRPQVITSLDLAKRDDVLPGLRQVHWDLVIVDEAHRMSWTPPSRKTERYALGELLRDCSDHLLLLTATPHKGDPENFSLFLQLLDQDAYADVTSIREAIREQRAPFYLRRTKEAMVHFPERQPDGSWVARKIFTKRIPHTASFNIDGAEFELYRAVTQFVKRQSARAAAQGDDPRARAVGFLMSLYQRRLASSTYSLRASLEKRAKRQEEALRSAQQIMARGELPAVPSEEELEEMEDAEREKLERILDAITLAQNPDQVRAEVEELKRLALEAKALEEAGDEAKLSKLKTLLHEQGFFDRTDQRLLIFTEFKDTLDYLVQLLRGWGFQVGFIHGSMKIGTRDEPGTRLYTEQQFREGAIQILVATEAAGEGINLQCCHILFNYDIPWNPNRLEQRMGRIHRYGQLHDCLIFNFVAVNTVEGRVLEKLLEKLQEIRNALDDDAVFNVVGEVLPAAHVERVLRDYYTGQLGDADLEDRLLHDVREDRFRQICQNALEGLAAKSLNLDMLIERRAQAQERRLVPERIDRFLRDAAAAVPLPLKPLGGLLHSFDQIKVPTLLRRYDAGSDWRLPAVAERYPRSSTDREVAEGNNLEWITPGHPLFEALRRHALDKSQGVFGTGAAFYSLQHQSPVRIDIYRARAVDGLHKIIHERLFVVEVKADGAAERKDQALLGNFSPSPMPPQLPAVAMLPEPTEWLHAEVLRPFITEIQQERMAEIDRVAHHVELSLTTLIEKADQEVGRAQLEKEKGVQGAEGRLAQAEARCAEYTHRRERRREALQRQRTITLQGVERLTSLLVLPHPEREAPEVRRLQPDREVELTAMRVVMERETARGCQVYDVSEKNLGYDVTSLDLTSGELRLIEVKGIGAESGTVLLTPNELRVAQDRRDCFWLYVVTNCKATPRLEEPINDPARFEWHEVSKVQHYWLEVNAMTRPIQVRELRAPPYGQEP